MTRSAHPAGPSHGHVLPGHDPAGPPLGLDLLNPLIWPANTERVDGELRAAGIGVTELAQRYGTPAFVLDTDDLRQRASTYAAAFAGGDVFYAGKAFLSTAASSASSEPSLIEGMAKSNRRAP